jgi:hypothetical protein
LCGTQGDTPLAVHTVLIYAVKNVIFLVIVVSIIGALIHADFAADTTILISFYDVFWGNITLHIIYLLG